MSWQNLFFVADARRDQRTEGEQDRATRAFSGEVETGSPQKTRQLKNLGHDPIQSDRIMAE